jgi:C4-dicarboxylate-specific signal transduction histidine kinase
MIKFQARTRSIDMATGRAIDKSLTGDRPLAEERRRQARRARRRWFPGAGLLVLAAALLVLAAILMAANGARLRGNLALVEHTEDVLRRVADLQIALVDVESAARAYTLTDNAAYLAAYREARPGVDAALAALGTLVADNPAQVSRLAALRPVLAERMTGFDAAVATAPSRRAELFSVGRVEAAQALRRQIRAALEEFRASEIALLGARQADADRAVTRSMALVGAIVLLSGAVAGLGIFLLQRERSQHRIRELQTELEHLSRLTTIGQTASMLAHEINQPLAATTNYLEAARRVIETEATPKTVKAAETLSKASAQVRRAGDIVSRLRQFIGKQERGRAAESLDGVVTDAVSLLGPIGERARLRTDIAAGIPAVAVDRVQIQQVLINLARNAIEAMDQGRRRELTILARPPEGDLVRVSVMDTGPGLPDEVKKQLFKPFVSTKPEGMGVGLSICRAIILDHGGRIWVEPNPGGGTVFHFTLPVATG